MDFLRNKERSAVARSGRETQTLIDQNRESISDNRYSISGILRSIVELVEYRNETEEIMRKERLKTEAAQRKTEASLDRLEETVAETTKAVKELTKTVAETTKTVAETTKTVAETTRTVAETTRTVAETTRTVNQVSGDLGSLGHMQGRVAEDLFYRNAVAQLRLHGVPVAHIERNLKLFGGSELDLVAYDGFLDESGALHATCVAIIEIKNRPTVGDTKKLLEKQIPYFIRFMAQHPHLFNDEHYAVIGAIGGLIVDEHVHRHAEQSGIYVLTQRGEDGASIVNADDFIPRDFVTGSAARI